MVRIFFRKVAVGILSLAAVGLSIDAIAVDLSNAEVIVTSSTNASYVGMTNTDAQGKFSLNGVPAGGVNVVVRRNGEVIANGATVTQGGNLSDAQIINIVVAPPVVSFKSK